jgi:hypothetical protein
VVEIEVFAEETEASVVGIEVFAEEIVFLNQLFS